MKGDTPWLVIVTDGSVPSTVMCLRCNRCRDVYHCILPASTDKILKVHDHFKAMHKACKEGEQ